jgi:hypothetical protein
MKVNYFKFEVMPMVFPGTHGGEEKLLNITVHINDQERTESRILPNVRPFETELEYYAHQAIAAIQNNIKEVDNA